MQRVKTPFRMRSIDVLLGAAKTQRRASQINEPCCLRGAGTIGELARQGVSGGVFQDMAMRKGGYCTFSRR